MVIQVLPNMASVVDIEAVSYGVCGVVQMVSAGYKAKVKSQFLFSTFFFVICRVFMSHFNSR